MGPYSSTPIKIASASGTGTITFDKIAEPTILPEIIQNRVVKTTMSRPSASHPGLRIFTTLGSSVNLCDIEFTLPFVTTTQYNTLSGYFNSRPGVILVSLDGGTTRYHCLFKPDGLSRENYRLNEREFFKVTLKLMIIQSTTTDFEVVGS